MGNNSSASSRSSTTSTTADNCPICLLTARARGGEALYTPGCCGKWFHQSCIDQLRQSGNNSCPNCRGALPALPSALMPPPQHLPQQQQFQQVQQQPPQSVFNFSSSSSRRLQTRSSLSSSKQQSYSDTEDLLDVADSVPAEPTATVSTAGGASNDSLLTIKCTPERKEVSLEAISDFFLNVNVKAASSIAGAPVRLAMDIVCVLDNSGSMDGSKMSSVKEAMRFIRSQLTAQDRLSVVIFNSRATTIHGLLKMNDTQKASSGAQLDAVAAGGGTDIYDGMSVGHNILASRRTKNTVSCMFLLTDGCDDSHKPEKMELARRIRAEGHSLFVFGFGNDHDGPQLESIANAAEGTFVFVESDDVVVDAFGGALGGQQGIAARNITLSISLDPTDYPSPSALATPRCDLLHVHSGTYVNTISADRRTIEVQFANIYLGEQRDVLLQVSLPSSAVPVDRFPVISATCQFTGMSSEERLFARAAVDVEEASEEEGKAQEESAMAVESARDLYKSYCLLRRKNDPSPECDIGVDVQKSRAVVNAALDQARRLADARNYTDSRALLNATLTTINASPAMRAQNGAVASMAEDLAQTMDRTLNDSTYVHGGGRSATLESYSNNCTQRVVYKKASKMHSAYQCESSVVAQESAMVFKGSKIARK